MAQGRFLFDEAAREKRRWTLFAVGACALAAVVMAFDLAHAPQLKLQEAWYGIRGARKPSPQVAIVGGFAAALVIGIIAGVAPARRAAAMDPVEALRAE